VRETFRKNYTWQFLEQPWNVNGTSCTLLPANKNRLMFQKKITCA